MASIVEDGFKPRNAATGASRSACPVMGVMGTVMVVAMLAGISQAAIGSPGAADAKGTRRRVAAFLCAAQGGQGD